MKIEVVRDGTVLRVEVEPGATAAEVLRACGLEGDAALGSHGQRIRPEQRLADGDRVEILRPLRVPPGEARRRRARKVDRAVRRP
jgi:putative ubiquitin-RnfH superfamily antitoxin RatB of RatAB toxin-antitoxin module